MEIHGSNVIQQEFDEYPVIRASLLLPDNTWSPEIEFIVDTGFTGDVILSNKLMPIWQSAVEVHPELSEIGESITGETFKLTSVYSKILLDKQSFNITMSSHAAVGDNLIGWNLLRRFTTLLEESKISLFIGSG
ncbi:MAG: hypothetical protein INQ03_10575 [Candidatus Heimdallarchaeota archaeon]|nr:hypothetical protein [Candidatus Heimdallarchaeota archaeon]